MNQTIEYFKFYNKENLENKMAGLYTLIVPIVFMVFLHFDWIGKTPDNYMNTLTSFWTFIILLSIFNGYGIALLTNRENGFLKVFSFISGSKNPIIIGKMFSQILHLCIVSMIFTLVISFVFQLNIFSLLVHNFVLVAIVSVPLSFLSLVVPLLPMREETVAPVFTLFNLLLVYTATFNFQSNVLNTIFTILNPAGLTYRSSQLINNFLTNGVFNTTQGIILGIGLVIYILIGIVVMNRMGVVSIKRR